MKTKYYLVVFLPLSIALPVTNFSQVPLLEVKGAIKIGEVNSDPPAGTIRYNNSAFEGWNGTTWVPLSKFSFAGTVTDVDGNEYETVQICGQLWMAENLRATRYNDGAAIQISVGSNITNPGATGTMYYPDDDPNNASDYGALYDFYCVETNKLCPVGWHVPDHNEWIELSENSGGYFGPAGLHLKETGTDHWLAPNLGATNREGFTARGNGGRDGETGAIEGLKEIAWWWSSTTDSNGAHISWCVSNSSDGICHFDNYSKAPGHGIRCIKDL